MLEYLRFRFGGYFSGYCTIKITHKNGELQFVFNDHINELDVTASCPDHGWTERLAALHIEDWEHKYGDMSADDERQWHLDYKVQGQEKIQIYGSNDCPDNWVKLIELLEELHPSIDFWILG